MTGKIITTITKSISIITRFKPRKNKEFRDVTLRARPDRAQLGGERSSQGPKACNCLKKEEQNNYEEISDLRQFVKK